MRIETQRLLLRPLTLSDVDALVQIWTDPEVTQYMGGPRDPEKVRANVSRAFSTRRKDRSDWTYTRAARAAVLSARTQRQSRSAARDSNDR